MLFIPFLDPVSSAFMPVILPVWVSQISPWSFILLLWITQWWLNSFFILNILQLEYIYLILHNWYMRERTCRFIFYLIQNDHFQIYTFAFKFHNYICNWIKLYSVYVSFLIIHSSVYIYVYICIFELFTFFYYSE